MHSNRPCVGFFGQTHMWPSVERCRQFFLRALGVAFDVTLLPDVSLDRLSIWPDAILNFGSWNGWSANPESRCAIAFMLLGGPVLDREFLASHIGNLREHDCLLVTCQSDVNILREICPTLRAAVYQVTLPVDSEAFKPRYCGECRVATAVVP